MAINNFLNLLIIIHPFSPSSTHCLDTILTVGLVLMREALLATGAAQGRVAPLKRESIDIIKVCFFIGQWTHLALEALWVPVLVQDLQPGCGCLALLGGDGFTAAAAFGSVLPGNGKANRH